MLAHLKTCETMGSRMHLYICSQNGLLVATLMWWEGLLGVTDSLRRTERYFERWTYLPAHSIWCTNIQVRWTERYIGKWTFGYTKQFCKFLQINTESKSLLLISQPCTYHVLHKNAIFVNKRRHIICWHLTVAGEELHVCHAVQKPWTRSPRHPSRARELKLNKVSVKWNTIQIVIDLLQCSAVFIYCPFPRHCIPFLHPRVQNAGHIQHVL